MQYRPFGKLDWQISAPGFGAMRLLIVGGEGSKIDEAQTGEMLCYRTG